ncbi:MAG: LptA/OstA family protein [Pseudohongiellaceae bacterium]
MHRTGANRITTAFFLLLPLLPQASLSLEADSSQEVQWDSGGDLTMRVEGETRILEMTENVRVTQGSLEIVGSRAIFEYNAETNELRRVTIHGSPVRYRQELDSGDVVTGISETMLLYRDEIEGPGTVIELIGNARIDSQDSSMSCAAIVYLAGQDLIREATGPCQGTLGSSGNQ